MDYAKLNRWHNALAYIISSHHGTPKGKAYVAVLNHFNQRMKQNHGRWYPAEELKALPYEEFNLLCLPTMFQVESEICGVKHIPSTGYYKEIRAHLLSYGITPTDDNKKDLHHIYPETIKKGK